MRLLFVVSVFGLGWREDTRGGGASVVCVCAADGDISILRPRARSGCSSVIRSGGRRVVDCR